MMDTEHIRQIVREELRNTRMEWNAELFNQLAPFRAVLNRLVRDIYGENPDGSRADGGGMLEMAQRNNVLLWVTVILTVINFLVTVTYILLAAGHRIP